MKNNQVLVLIVGILLGILGYVIVMEHKETPQEKIANSVDKVADKITDKIDEHTK